MVRYCCIGGIKMERKELLTWAIKGLSAEIDELDGTIRKGKKHLEEYRQGKQMQTKKTPEEIKTIIQEKQKQIELLDKKRFDLSWERDVEQ
jgi:hypothetical protein